jgi:predicted lipid carrier protein YhbT
VVRVDVVDWLALVSGKTSGGELLFSGRLSIDGDESRVVALLGHLDREHQPF